MLMRLAYLTVSNVFAVLRLLPVSDREKDAEILACATSSACSSGSSVTSGCASARPIEHCLPRCCTRCPDRRYGDYGFWYARTPSYGGTATCSPVDTPHGHGPNTEDGHPSSGRFA